jgi:hypothetical protein
VRKRKSARTARSVLLIKPHLSRVSGDSPAELLLAYFRLAVLVSNTRTVAGIPVRMRERVRSGLFSAIYGGEGVELEEGQRAARFQIGIWPGCGSNLNRHGDTGAPASTVSDFGSPIFTETRKR